MPTNQYPENYINTIIAGDNMDALPHIPDNTVDLIVTDPPYALKFMGKKWDEALPPVEAWKECLRILKPGAFAFVMSIPRQDCLSRMIINLEDAGFMVNFSPIFWAYACLSEDTEILTKDGWERLQKTTKYGIIEVASNFSKKEVLIYDTDSGTYRWEVPERWNVFHIEDTCFRIESDTTDQFVSKDHRVAVEYDGKIVFRFAETLGQTVNVPYLENLRRVWENLSHDPIQDKGGNQTEYKGEVLHPEMQWHRTGAIQKRPKQTSQNWRTELDRGTERKAKTIHDGREEPCMERRGNISQNKRQLYGAEICTVSKEILGNGTPGRMGMQTTPNSSPASRQDIVKHRSGASRRQEYTQRFPGESHSLRIERRPHEVRTRPAYQTTVATVTEVPYSGIVYCPTVSTGCFVARRNGKIFLTGNSGFPKAANVSKMVDSRLGAEREVVGEANYTAPDIKGNSYDQPKVADRERLAVRITAPATPEAAALDGSFSGLQLKPALEVVLCVQKPYSDKHRRSDVYRMLGGRYDYWYTQQTVVVTPKDGQKGNWEKLTKKWEAELAKAGYVLKEGDVIERRLALTADNVDEVMVNREVRLRECPYTNSDLTSSITHALATGKGITWLDDARIPYDGSGDQKQQAAKNPHTVTADNDVYGDYSMCKEPWVQPQGRFPANLLVSDDCLNDGQIRKGVSGGGPKKYGGGGGWEDRINRQPVKQFFNDSGPFSRYFSLDSWAIKNLPESALRTFPFMIIPKPSKREKNAGLDELPKKQMYRCDNAPGSLEIFGTTDGGRQPRQNTHATVKPIKLMSWLITIGSRPGDVVVDPYAGSCTTCVAAAILDRIYTGMELEEEMCEIGELRVKWHVKQKEIEAERKLEERERQLELPFGEGGEDGQD